jgi:signal peptidase I
MQSETNNPGRPSWLRTILIGRRPKFTLIRIVVLVITCYVAFGFILLPIQINGPSMLPAYREKSVHCVFRLAFLRQEPQRGDVVSIRISGEEYSADEFFRDLKGFGLKWSRLSRPSVMYMKRVVGRPGETIEFLGGKLVVNGEAVEEPYVQGPCRWHKEPRRLGPKEYFVVGDNRSMPIELHEMGVPLRSHIVGKVFL